MEGKNLLEFRDKIHNFKISIKNPLNFSRFNLVLARLKFNRKIWCKIKFSNIFQTKNILGSIQQNLFYNFLSSNGFCANF
jgi:hypothetical protein